MTRVRRGCARARRQLSIRRLGGGSPPNKKEDSAEQKQSPPALPNKKQGPSGQNQTNKTLQRCRTKSPAPPKKPKPPRRCQTKTKSLQKTTKVPDEKKNQRCRANHSAGFLLFVSAGGLLFFPAETFVFVRQGPGGCGFVRQGLGGFLFFLAGLGAFLGSLKGAFVYFDRAFFFRQGLWSFVFFGRDFGAFCICRQRRVFVFGSAGGLCFLSPRTLFFSAGIWVCSAGFFMFLHPSHAGS